MSEDVMGTLEEMSKLMEQNIVDGRHEAAAVYGLAAVAAIGVAVLETIEADLALIEKAIRHEPIGMRTQYND